MITDQDLQFETVITESKCTRIHFFLNKFNLGKISVNFPKYSVLGSRSIRFEIFIGNTNPFHDSSSTEENLAIKKLKLLTPALYVSQKRHTPFLQPVPFRLPFFKHVHPMHYTPQHCQKLHRKLTIFGDYAEVETRSFSSLTVWEKQSNVSQFSLRILGIQINPE